MKKTISSTVPGGILVLLCALLLAGCGGSESKEDLMESGEKYFSEGKYEEAKIEFLKVLQKDQEKPEPFARLGQIWREQGAMRKALPFLMECKRLAPENIENRIGLAETMLALGGRAECRQEVLEILAKSPEHGRALILLADSSSTPEQLEEAETLLDAITNSSQVSVLVSKAILALKRSELDVAADLTARALESDPKSFSAWNVKATTHGVRKELPESAAALEKAAELAPARSLLRIKYARFLLGTAKQKEAEEYLAELTSATRDFLPAWRLRAELAVAQQDYSLAEKHLNDIFGTNPQDLEGLLLEAQIWLAKGETEKALERIKGLRDSLPNHPAIEFQLARAYLLASNPGQADAALDRAIGLNPNFNAAIMLRARLNLRQGDPDKVIDAMTKYLQRLPNDFQAQLLLADAYRGSGDSVQAERVLANRTAEGGDDFRPYLFLGIVQRQLNKDAEAREQFEEAQRLAPDNLLVISQLTSLDLSKEKFEEASARIAEQLSRDPESPGAHYLNAQVLVAQRQWEESEAALKEAIRFNPDFLAAYQLLTRVLNETGRLESAAQKLEEFLAENPDSTPALMQLCTVRQMLKEFEKARDGYERLLKIDSTIASAHNNLAWIYSEHFDNQERAIELAQRAQALPMQPFVAASLADTLGWAYYRQGEWKPALSNLREAVGQLQENPIVQYHLGMAAYMMDQRDLAREALQKAVGKEEDFPGKEEARQRLALLTDGARGGLPVAALREQLKASPGDLLVHTDLAKALEREKQFEEAAAEYGKIVKSNPQLPSAQSRLAVLYAGPLQDIKKALDHARKARDLAPGDAALAGTLGSVAFQGQNYDWSLSLLREAAGAAPSDPEILHDLAWAEYSQGRVAEAREAMERASAAVSAAGAAPEPRYQQFLLLTDPAAPEPDGLESSAKAILAQDESHVPALMVQAAIDEAATRHPEAVAAYQKVLAKFPDFAPATRGMAIAYSHDPKTWEEAERLALKARETLSDDPELASVLAALNFPKGRPSYVVGLLKEVAAQRELSAIELFHLGMSQAELGTDAEARTNLQKALDAGLPAPEAEKAKAWIAEAKE